VKKPCFSEELFLSLLNAASEEEASRILENYSTNDPRLSWHSMGGNENNFGIIENQQSSPIGALIEKITNAIDAILIKKCLQADINPKSNAAPKSMAQAIEKFFQPTFKNWHLNVLRRQQAESIQILAFGSTKRPCILIYDDGEGQNPIDFERTFLSLLRGNKNEIPFVQGKYNMGGTGAIVFCGHNRYQLIGSKRFNGETDFGFTLVRKHPLTREEEGTRKNTWYEYLKIDGTIPSFQITDLDIGLTNRKFVTGTIIKLFDYDLPVGTRGALPQEPRRAIDQYLFEPALPVYLVDTKERYPNNRVLQIDCFGLKRRLEGENKYIEKTFSIASEEHDIGKLKITCYVFRSKVDGQSAKETKDNVEREFFHDSMAVLFSLNGQVHGHFTSEFITRALEMQLLKHHLLIHVDCTALNYGFRNELFMASRDRLKAGDETNMLRKRVAAILRKSELLEIYNQRKNAITVEGGDTQDLLKAFSKNLPFNKDLMRLLNQTFKIEQSGDDNKLKPEAQKPKIQKIREPFNPTRYPSFFKLRKKDDHTLISIPQGEEKIVQFSTDVEDNYFDRVDDPGTLQIAILRFKRNAVLGGNNAGPADDPSTLLDIRKSSPKDGTIRIGFGVTNGLRTGDEIEVQAVLGGPEDFECRFWVKIVEPTAKPKDVEKPQKQEEPPMGLPNYVLVYHERPPEQPNVKIWADIEAAGIQMDWPVVMHPFVENEQLNAIYINMDSSVLRNYKSRLGNLSPEQAAVADKRYISSVYFHTVFLYSITKNRQYEMKKAGLDTDLSDYLRDVFSSPYSDFLLNFGMDQLIQSLSD